MQLKEPQGEASTELMMEVERDVAAPEKLLPMEPEKPSTTPSGEEPPPVMEEPASPNMPSVPNEPIAPEQPETPAPPAQNEEPITPLPDEPSVAQPPQAHLPPPPAVPPAQPHQPPSHEAPKRPSKPAPRPAPTRPPGDNLNIPRGLIGVTANAFFNTRYGDPRLPLTKLTIDHMEKNFQVRQVQDAIKEYKKGGKRRAKMANYYIYGNPFVELIDAVAETYDVPPAFAFLLMVESEYFNVGRETPPYSFTTPSTTTAGGPFQLIYGTARTNGMAVLQNAIGQRPRGNDERNFFFSSACGAANYLSKNINLFKAGDATLGFMAYFQGEGNIENVVARVKRLGHDFSFSFEKIARNHMVRAHVITYVARILAAYFVSGDYRSYGFSLQGARTTLPANAVPSFTIRSDKCRMALGKLHLS